MTPSGNEHDTADVLSRFLLDVIKLAEPPKIPACFASVGSVKVLYDNLLSLREFLIAASHGDLSKQVAMKGYLGGTLKTLQSHLKHMTWQTKMVASGDFSQRIEFMGEFSQSFNAMVMQLDRTLKELIHKETELSQVNTELLQEITIRKQTEAVLRESEEAMRLLAITDALTGLYNRRHFDKLAEDEIGRAIRYARPLSIIMLDIDFFKRINDTCGHSVGDRVLQRFAALMNQMIRTSDIAARYGGEEFIIMLPETPVVEAAAIAERLRKQIEQTTIHADKCILRITASLGVNEFLLMKESHSQSNETMLSELVAMADLALYTSKTAGRNRITVYSPEIEKLR